MKKMTELGQTVSIEERVARKQGGRHVSLSIAQWLVVLFVGANLYNAASPTLTAQEAGGAIGDECTKSFVERFNDGSPAPHLNLVLNSSGAVVDYDGDFTVVTASGARVYLASQASDYHERDFLFSAEVTIPSNSAWSIPFFGMGNPTPSASHFYEPSLPNLLLATQAGPQLRLAARDNTSNGAGVLNYSTVLGSMIGTHGVEMAWSSVSQVAAFRFDYHNDGSVDQVILLEGFDNGFDSSNSHLILGGGGGVTFDNISVRAGDARNVIETFTSGNLGSNLVLGPNSSGATVDFLNDFTVTSGAGSRVYLASAETDYNKTSFVFSSLVTIPSNSHWSIPFFGMGDPSPFEAFFYEPSVPNLLMATQGGPQFRLAGRDNTFNGAGILNYPDHIGDLIGTHRMEMSWLAESQEAVFRVDAGNDGTVDSEFSLMGADNGFNDANSILMLGGGDGVTFDDLSVIAQPERELWERFNDHSPFPQMHTGPNPSNASVNYDDDFTVTSGEGSRVYLVSNASNYESVDFVFSAEVTISSGSAWSIPFFGMANPEPQPGFYFEPGLPNLLMATQGGLDLKLAGRDNTSNGGGVINFPDRFGNPIGTHGFSMIWNSSTRMAEFRLDYQNDGTIDHVMQLDGGDNGFDGENSQLVLGGGNGVTFDNIAVSLGAGADPPVARCKDLNLVLDENGVAVLTAESVDNGSFVCSGPALLSIDRSHFDCSDVGLNSVVLTVTDQNGLSSQCTSTVTIEDRTPPVFGAATTLFEENFEDYAVGSWIGHQGGWDPRFSANNQAEWKVVDEFSTSPSNGLQVFGINSLAGEIHRPVEIPTGATIVRYQAAIRAGGLAGRGIHKSDVFLRLGRSGNSMLNTTGTLEIRLGKPNQWWNLDGIHGFVWDGGYVGESIELKSGYEGAIETWWQVAVEVDLLTQRAAFFLDGQMIGDVALGVSWSPGTWYVSVGSGDGKGWVDDIEILARKETSSSNPFVVELGPDGSGALAIEDVALCFTDECGIDSVSLDRSQFDCSDLGKTNAIVTAFDVNGNFTDVSLPVLVVDPLAPHAVARDITVALNADGLAGIARSDIDAGSVDNCGVASLSLDVDSFDCSNLGPNIVTMTVTDVSGNAASATATVTIIDVRAPNIILAGNSPQVIECGSPYVELGATVVDDCDESLGSIVIDASGVNTAVPGTYSVTYNISDSSGNAALEVVRTVTVIDATPPVITLLGVNPQVIECPSPYVELGATASDDCDQALGPVVIDANAVDSTKPGNYTVTYDISDASGNAALQLTRTVTVVDTTPPVITPQGADPQIIECPSPYVELGAMAADTCDQNLGAVVIDTSAVDTTTPGSYTVTYDISDSSGNAAVQVTRTVVVQDTTPPVITLLGDNPQIIECPSPYFELGATAVDACDQNLGAVLIDASAVDTTTPGSYTVTYDISDAHGNAATQVTRTVVVQDTTPPVITLTGAANLTVECSVDTYTELGATVSDACDPNVTVVIGGDTVDPTSTGTYVVTYGATDSHGNVAIQLTRTVVVEDTTPPVITLSGYSPQLVECPDPYEEAGATASDLCDGDLTAEIVIDADNVDVTIPGTYEVTYTVVDAAGNSTTETREVETVDTTVPVITLTGESTIVLLQGDTYVEEGATVTDTCDQSVTVVIGGDVVDASVIGVYVVTYDSTDSSGNAATQVTRTVTVLPRFAALDALFGCTDLKAEQDAIVNGSVGSTEKVDLRSNSSVTGNVVNVTGKVDLKSKANVGGNIDAGGQVTVHNNASVGVGVLSGEKIELKKNASVGGDATSGGQVKLGNGASVAGTITENAAVTPLADIPLPVLALTTSGSNVMLKNNKSATILPGAYKQLSGKQNTTISLSSGHYTFQEIDIDKGSVLELDVSAGPITVDVVKGIDFDGVEMVLTGGSAMDVLFQVQGDQVKLGTANAGNNGSDSSGSGSGSSQGAGNSNKLGSYVGTYLVPNGQVTLEDGGVLTGSAYAEKVHLKQESVVNPEPALDLLISASTTWLGLETCIEPAGGSSGKSGSSAGSSKESSGSSQGSGSSKAPRNGFGISQSGSSEEAPAPAPGPKKGKKKTSKKKRR